MSAMRVLDVTMASSFTAGNVPIHKKCSMFYPDKILNKTLIFRKPRNVVNIYKTIFIKMKHNLYIFL